MNIAVVGDVHGHLALMYGILGDWQYESGQRIDLIVQLGDLGAFTSASKLDQATKRYAERDPEELGFAEYAGPSPPSTLLDPRPPLVFIPGNHEDFGLIENAGKSVDAGLATFPLTQDGAIRVLRSGMVYDHNADDGSVRIAGISGVGTKDNKKSIHRMAHLDEASAIELAELGPRAFDILISHDAPSGLTEGPPGSEALRLVIEEVQPALAFFAHYDWIGEDQIGTTIVTGLGCCSYDVKKPVDDWPVQQGGFAMLNGSGGAWNVERLAPAWLQTATRRSWRRWQKVK